MHPVSCIQGSYLYSSKTFRLTVGGVCGGAEGIFYSMVWHYKDGFRINSRKWRMCAVLSESQTCTGDLWWHTPAWCSSLQHSGRKRAQQDFSFAYSHSPEIKNNEALVFFILKVMFFLLIYYYCLGQGLKSLTCKAWLFISILPST